MTNPFEMRSTQIPNLWYDTDGKEFSKAGEHRRQAVVAYVRGATRSTVCMLGYHLQVLHHINKASFFIPKSL